MELYIGGMAQGKLTLVQNEYPQARVLEPEAALKELIAKENANDTIIWNRFHESIRIELNQGSNPEKLKKLVMDLLSQFPNLVIISDEIGNGIVPMEAELRFYREYTGRLLIEVAKRADKVVRVVCQIPQRIK